MILTGNKYFKYGIKGLPLELLSSYLKNQRHKVKINNCFSEHKILNLGVPRDLFCELFY